MFVRALQTIAAPYQGPVATKWHCKGRAITFSSGACWLSHYRGYRTILHRKSRDCGSLSKEEGRKVSKHSLQDGFSRRFRMFLRTFYFPPANVLRAEDFFEEGKCTFTPSSSPSLAFCRSSQYHCGTVGPVLPTIAPDQGFSILNAMQAQILVG